MKNIKIQHIKYILRLSIKDREKLELIKCYLESGVIENSPVGNLWTPNPTPYPYNGTTPPCINGAVSI